MDKKLDEFARSIARAEFQRVDVPPELDRAVLAYARTRKVRRKHWKPFVSVFGAAAAMLIAAGILFLPEFNAKTGQSPVENPKPVAVQTVAAAKSAELSNLWNWTELEAETLELNAAAEYSGVAIASL